MKARTARGMSLERLAALQQLSSPALPIGGFSYSQGLESAVELGLVHDPDSACGWIDAQLHTAMIEAEAPIWCLLYRAWERVDAAALARWSGWFRASRENREIREETRQMGKSLASLAAELGWGTPAQHTLLQRVEPMTLPLVHSMVCAAWQIPPDAGLAAYLLTWLENQTTAAIKSIPIGQVAAQRILQGLRPKLPALVAEAERRSTAQPPDLMTLAPQYGIIAARHESQFSRLFRS
jgi:urease accessory protein